MSNDEKSRQLGMSHSTARSRLVKMLLFRELQRSGGDICIRCGDVIDDIDHLSIEHKEPWLHVSPDLYWDLDNVEFSHLVCNRPHRYPGNPNPPNRIERPDGMDWCGVCRTFKAVGEFNRNPSRYTGRDDRCTACKNEYNRRRRNTQVAEGAALERQ